MSTLSVGTLENVLAGAPPVVRDANGAEIGTFCRAWVLFSGLGSTTIFGSFNVASVTYLGVGRYAVNFINPMPSENYVLAVETNAVASFQNRSINISRTWFSTTSTGEIAYLENNTVTNTGTVCVAVFA